MLELAVVMCVVISVGLFLRLRDLEKQVDVLERWADWLEDEILNENNIILTLEGDRNDERKNQ